MIGTLRSGLAIGVLLISTCFVTGCAGSSDKIQEANMHRRMGEGYLNQKNAAKALAEFQKGLELNPKDPQLWHYCGLAFLIREEYDKAETYLKKAIDLDPALSDARNHLGVTFLAENRPSEALEQFDKALEDPDFTQTGMAFFNRGKALLLLDQPQSAVEAFERSIERNPADIRAYLELAELHLKQKDPRKSAFAARRAIEFYPQDYRAWFMLGRALQAQNDRTGALEALQKVQKFAPPETDEYSRAGSLIRMIKTQ